MKKDYLLILIFNLCFSNFIWAQKVSNISAEQVGQSIQVSYNLETELPCSVSLYYSTDNGAKWQGPLQKVSGDVGVGVSPGFNKIKWDVIEELVNFISHDVQFKIEAIEEFVEMPPTEPKLMQDNLQTSNEDKVFTYIPVMPQFPGGEIAMNDYLKKNVIYPKLAVDSNITGKVFVNFVIDKEGNVTDAKILRGIGGGCDEEVVRLVESMPKWTPGELETGERVKVSFNLPISFTLNKRNQNK